MFTFDLSKIHIEYKSNLFDCTIIAIFPILYFRYSISVVTITIITILYTIVTILYTIVLSHVITITIRF